MQTNAHISDSSLIDDYKRTENTSAIETLFLRYSHIIYLVCNKYLKDEEESKDSVMEIFQKLLVDCKQYDIINFRAWLHTVTKNHCLMKIRKANKLKIYLMPSEEIDSMAVENDNLVNLTGEENFDWDSILNSLCKEQKLCIELFYYDEKSYKEIAQINGMDIHQVKSHIQNGKRNLKNLLKKDRG
jgi:RNA polymerase sigma-70 factor (ECF subfamily)